MKYRIKITFAVVGIMAAMAILISNYSSFGRQTTFRAEVTDHMSMLDTLDRLDIRKIHNTEPYDDEVVTIRNSKEIRDMLRLLKDVELQKVSEVDVADSSPYYYEWRLTINKEGRSAEGFGIMLYDNQFVSIYNDAKTRDKLEDYKITNDELNLDEINRLFENLMEEQK